MTSTRLCSNYEPEHRVTCDLPEGHKGIHEAKVLWGDAGTKQEHQELLELIGRRYE